MLRNHLHRLLLLFAVAAAPFSATLVPGVARAGIGADAIQDSLEASAFRYFWYQANAANGLIRDRSTGGSPASIAAVGFGLSAICVGVEHGWVSRAAAATRVLTTLQTFWNGPQSADPTNAIGYHGFFYHFLDMNTALRFMPGTWNPELSTIDTALLLAGILDARQYFNGGAADEVQIRSLADQIYQRVDWPFMQNTSGSHAWSIRHGWKPGTGYLMCGGTTCDWIGYSEAMILYILAAGSPTTPIANPGMAWSAWTNGYSWQTQYGYSYVNFPPLFGHQYSHCWIDFRGIQDAYMQGRGITYFENSRRATYAQQAYAIANPLGRVGYSATLWGLTASDDPCVGYQAHGAPPGQNDNGTITPTAPLSSIAFAPEICIPVAQNLYDTYQAQLWGPYGFKDAFNLTFHYVSPNCVAGTWYDTDVLGIDQGPIILMIENYRSNAVWNRFVSCSEIQLGLQRAGFVGAVGVPGEEAAVAPALDLRANPNPFGLRTTLAYVLPHPMQVRIAIFDLAGREVRRLVDAREAAGFRQAILDAGDLPTGVFRARLEVQGRVVERTIVHFR
ncbi:MAG TPA: glucoamylase family protein [Candidatus Eisenbacteria bacterium]|jgi:hypothetical protein